MASSADFSINIISNTADADGKIDKLAKNLERAMGDSEKSVDRFANTATSGFDRAVAAGSLAADMIKEIGQAGLEFTKDSLTAYSDAEQAQMRLQRAFRQFPLLADSSYESMARLNRQIMESTGFDDDAAAAAEGRLAQYDLTGQEIEHLMPLLADYARAQGIDLPDAAEKFGLSLLGNTRALKAVGIEYTSTGDRATDLHNITTLLDQKVGGMAEEFAGTYAGKMTAFQTTVENLQESFGEGLAPSIESATGQLAELGATAGGEDGVIAMLGRGAGAAVGGIITVVTAIGTGLGIAAANVYLWFEGDFIPWIQGVFGSVGEWFGWLFTDAIPNAFASAVNWLLGSIEWATNGLIDLINGATGAISAIWTWIPGAEGSGIPAIPHVALQRVAVAATPMKDGGVLTAPTLILGGEAGTEAIVPLDRAAEFGFGGGPLYAELVINLDGKTLARQIRSVELAQAW